MKDEFFMPATLGCMAHGGDYRLHAFANALFLKYLFSLPRSLPIFPIDTFLANKIKYRFRH